MLATLAAAWEWLVTIVHWAFLILVIGGFGFIAGFIYCDMGLDDPEIDALRKERNMWQTEWKKAKQKVKQPWLSPIDYFKGDENV
jgi:hypothetical protein